MQPTLGWRKWRLEFGNILSQDGVVDGRGVVSLKYGTTKGQEGTLKGYGVRSFRFPGESGKAWFREQKALGQKATSQKITKAKPEEVIDLRWVSPLTFRVREYRFNWRGFNFIWKGTGKAQTKMIFRPMLRFNHLKLVVLLPEEEEKKLRTTEVTLARYTSVMGARKMGRLELDQAAIDAFLVEHMADIDQADPYSQVHDDKKSPLADVSAQPASEQILSRVHQRMIDVILATGMSMIIGEYQKRQVVISIILAAANGSPN